MSFHFKVDLSLAFPPPPPRSSTQSQVSDPAHSHDIPQNKRGLPGWLQTARQHPQFTLRIFYSVAALIGIILENVVMANISSYSHVADVHRSAFGPLIIGLLWQIMTLCSKRIFRGRQIPNWAIALVETIGCLAFVALLVSNAIAMTDDQRYSSSFDLAQVMLVTYASAAWVALWQASPLLNGALAIQCFAQGWRNVRPKRPACPHCESGRGKGKGRAGDDEEALLGSEAEESGETEAGPSEQLTSVRYRDEESRSEEV